MKTLLELWDTLKRVIIEVAKECTEKRPSSRSGFASVETLESIEESHAAKLAGNRDQYRALSYRNRALLRREGRGMLDVSLRMLNFI